MNVLNLSKNLLIEEISSSLLSYVQHNIFIEELALSGNDQITSKFIKKIDDGCR